METNSTDTRRVHTTVTFRNGERKEGVVWGDVRTVFISLEPQEVPDQMNDGSHGSRTLFRPERVTLQWQRNTRWGLNSVNQVWKGGLDGDGWHLITARIDGTTIKKNGEPGKIQSAAQYADGEGWGVYALTAAPPPDWFAALLDEHDPNKGSPLDDEPKG